MLTTNDNAIEVFLRAQIDGSRAGDRLPSVRVLQRRFSASPVTVQRAIRVLVTEGLVVARPGDGTYVARRVERETLPVDHRWQTVVLGRATPTVGGLDHLTTVASSSTLLLDSGFPDRLLQSQSLLARFAIRAARRSESWERCLPEGLLSLRAVVAAELGNGFEADDVIIASGAQSAIGVVFRALLRPGDAVVIEDPSYPGAIAAATLAGLEVVPVPCDADGVLPDALATVLRRSQARVVFLQPRHANPTGAVLAVERRADVLRIARESSTFVVEDDWVRDLDLGTATPPPLCTLDPDGHVIYLRSFSKATAPGVRIAGLVARGPVAARLRTARLFTDFFASPLLQSALAEMLRAPEWPRHVRGLRAELRERRDVLLGTLAQHAPDLTCVEPAGGVAAWIRLPDQCDEAAFVAACGARGVRVGAGRPFWLTEPTAGYIRVSFAAAPSDELQVAAMRIADSLSDVRHVPGRRPRARTAAR